MHYTVITLNEMNVVMANLFFEEATGPSTTREYVYEKILIENPKIIIKVYSSISKQNGNGRGKGQDAIRICAVNITDRIGWIRTIKVLRVNGWRSNLLNAIYRVEKQARQRFERYQQSQHDWASGKVWRKIQSNGKPGQVWETNRGNLQIKRDECPACGRKYAKKDLITVKIKDENDPTSIEYWLFRCPNCRAFLKVNNA